MKQSGQDRNKNVLCKEKKDVHLVNTVVRRYTPVVLTIPFSLLCLCFIRQERTKSIYYKIRGNYETVSFTKKSKVALLPALWMGAEKSGGYFIAGCRIKCVLYL